MKPQTTFQIRPAVLSDCPAIARIQVDNYRLDYAGIFPPAYLEQFSYEEQTYDWQSLFGEESDTILLVAYRQSGPLTGYTLARKDAQALPGYDGEVVALHVPQAMRGDGIGRQLLLAAANGLIDQGCCSVCLWTLEKNPVRAWYERIGGQLVDHKQYMVDDTEVTEVAYGWKEIKELTKHLQEY